VRWRCRSGATTGARSRSCWRCHDAETAVAALSERRLLALLGGGCSVPLGALVTGGGGRYRIDAAMFGAGAVAPLRVRLEGADAGELAAEAARRLEPVRAQPLKDRRVLLVRPAEKGEGLAAALRAAGAAVVPFPVTRCVPVDPDPQVLATLRRFRWIVLTSRVAVQRLAAVLPADRADAGVASPRSETRPPMRCARPGCAASRWSRASPTAPRSRRRWWPRAAGRRRRSWRRAPASRAPS
jgi:hypothetical protein